MHDPLPIEALHGSFLQALEVGSVVVSSPTGSGKSTQIPRWCPGRVLVVEPRRVACRSLAQRVAQLEGTPLGEGVGYHVRDERRARDATRILFATPGIVLRIFDQLERFDTLILDEFHERGLEVDLLLALLLRRQARLVVMSATLAGPRVAGQIGGRHLEAEGRLFPVTVHYRGKAPTLATAQRPSADNLEEKVVRAVRESDSDPGDILVFLPGKGEIAACARALAGQRGLEVVELHGGLSLAEQSRAFEPASHPGQRKVVLATNVAETSVTIPGIGVVIDSGLVRQTRYFRGRGFLALVPIARDSAEQRAGRAGRTAPGVCYRLWSEAAELDPRTPPEMHRESLVPLVLAAAACGERVADLPFLDPPKEHAVETAVEELQALGALDGDQAITPRGGELFGLPLDPLHGRLLVEARSAEKASPTAAGVLDDVIDLVAVLSVGRPLYPRGASPSAEEAHDPAAFCDACRLIRGLRGGKRSGEGNPFVWQEARRTRARLRQAFQRTGGGASVEEPIDRRRLATTVLAADPRVAHIARARGGRGRSQGKRPRRVAWSNGGTEIDLARESAVGGLLDGAEEVEAILVLDTQAIGLGGKDARVLVTCAMPVPVAWLVEAGLGRDRLAATAVERGTIVSRVERVYARRVLAVREEVPQGALARDAVVELFLRGSLFREARDRTQERLEAAALAEALARSRRPEWRAALVERFGETVPSMEEWIRRRVEALGLESGDELPLLAAADFLAPELPTELQAVLDREYPRTMTLAGAVYRFDYDLARREVTLVLTQGRRAGPPPLSFLPRLPGLRIKALHKDHLQTLRER